MKFIYSLFLFYQKGLIYLQDFAEGTQIAAWADLEVFAGLVIAAVVEAAEQAAQDLSG